MEAQVIDERSLVKLNMPLIRLALRIRGWKQKDLARAIGVNESTVSRAFGPDGVTTLRIANKIRVVAFEGRLALEEVLDIPGMTPPNPPGIA